MSMRALLTLVLAGSTAAALSDEPALFEEVWSWSTKVLGLHPPTADAS